MMAYGLDVECPYPFDGTHFARWKKWMTCNFKFISPQMWWIVDVGFSHVLEEKNTTQAQKKCLHLDYQATNIFYQFMNNIFREIMYMKTTHDIWLYLNLIYGRVSNDDDDKPKEAHECVEHDHNLVIVEDCSTSWSSDDDDDDRSTMSSLDKIDGSSSSDANDDSISSTLIMLMMVHAWTMIMMLLQALLHHHITSCHKVTQRYKMLMWLIMLIQMMSLLIDLLA
jgi:hypothetical protein